MTDNTLVGHENDSGIGVIGAQDLGVISDIGTRVLDLLDFEDREQVNDSQNRLKELLGELKVEIQKLSDKIAYNYESGDYNTKLAHSQERINKFIEDNILNERLGFGELIMSIIKDIQKTRSKLGIIFDQIMSLYANEDLRLIIKEKIFKDYLEDLAYESIMGDLGYNKRLYSKISSIDENRFYRALKNIKNNKYFGLDCSGTRIQVAFTNKPNEFIKLIKMMGEKGVKMINLEHNDFSVIFADNKELFLSFIKIAGESGIRILHLQGCGLYNMFYDDINFLLQFIKIAGESGIRSLDFGSNRFFELFGTDSSTLIQFIKIAGESGIRSLDLSNNKLFELIGDDSFLLFQLIRTAGESGIKSLNLEYNEIFKGIGYNPGVLLQFIQSAGESGIKSLIFGTNVSIFFDNSIFGFIGFIEKAGECGIRHISLGSFPRSIVGKEKINTIKLINKYSKQGIQIVFYDL